MSRKYISLTTEEYHRLQAAAVKYGCCDAHNLARSAVMAEVLRIELIPTHPPKKTQEVLDQRSAAQEVLQALADLGATISMTSETKT